MEEKSPSVFKFSLSYGLITGVVLIVFELIMYLLEIQRESPVRYLVYVIFLAVIIWASKQYRDNYSDGFISYGKAFSVGFLVALIAAVISSIYTYVFITYIDPSIVEQALEAAEQNMMENGDLTDEQIDQALTMTERFLNPTMMALGAFFWYAVVSVVMSLVTSIFIKKE